jgi:hypothetical protein
MQSSVFRGFVALVSLVVTFGCQDDVQPKQWDLDNPKSDASDVGESSADTGTDAESGDVRSDADMFMGYDVGSDDVGPDGGGDVGRDLGPTLMTATGWYSSAFEHSGFVADSGGTPSVMVTESDCSPYVTPPDTVENWWTVGAPLNDARTLVAGGGSLSRMELTGELSPPGMYGHLGAYDRRFDVTEGSVLVCETARVVGHCVYPKPNDLCVIPSMSAVDPDSDPKPYLTETLGGQPNSPTSYELRLTYDEGMPDSRTDVALRWSLASNPDMPVGVDELESVSLEVEEHGVAFAIIPYDVLDGWVAHGPTAGDEWMVSVTGETEGGRSLRVWGSFPVDETIALP